MGLEWFDYWCFLKAFNESSPYADFDHDGDLDPFDFLAFQEAFAQGCW